MTSVVAAPTAQRRARRSVRALVAIEAPRSLTAPWVWVGMLGSTWFVSNVLSTDFAAGGYRGVMASFAVMAAALFVLGVQAGGRDHTLHGAVAPDAALEADARTL